MMFSSFLLLFSCALLGCHASFMLTRFGEHSQESAFMLISGISAPEEMCLVALGDVAGLEVCSAAIVAGDGRELWSFQAGGQLLHAVSKLCLSSSKASLGDQVGLVGCSSAGGWKLLPNGQLQGGDLCLSQSGLTSSAGNVALASAASASSTLNAESHGADAGADSDAESFWASKFDETDPVVFTLNFGEKRFVDKVSIEWEFPPLSYSVATSADGSTWDEVFENTANVLNISRIALGMKVASWLKIVMRKPHPVYGVFSGHSLYGIDSIAVSALGVHSTLADCSSASQSEDARDKYFASSASDLDRAPAQALLSEVSALDAAKASLSAVLAEVASIQPVLAQCRAKVSLPVLARTTLDPAMPHHFFQRSNSSFDVGSAAAGKELAALADQLHGIDADGVSRLLASAKELIRSTRHALV